MNQFSRTELLLGKDGLDILAKSHVAIFGIGGVGGFAVEALARVGVGKISLFDHDNICITNINRQIIATHETIGKNKVDLMKTRILQINPNAEVYANFQFYDQNSKVDLTEYDYIIDAVDTVTAKILLATNATNDQIPIISSMGTANKLDPTRLAVADIFETKVCPLARILRKNFKRLGIDKLKVVYSKEQPVKSTDFDKRAVLGSVSFVPSVAGMILASEVVKDLVFNRKL